MLKTNQEYLDQIKKVGEYNLKDTYKWRERALFFQEKAGKNWAEGYYTDLIEGTLDWDVFWDEEERRIMEGLWIDGFYIPGLFYFYLNYLPIYRKQDNEYNFPDVYDSDYHTFLCLEHAVFLKKHFGVIKKRQCVDENTLIDTPNGSFPIKDLFKVEYQGEVFSLGLDNELVIDTISEIWPGEETTEIYRVKIDENKFIDCLDSHLLRTEKGFRHVGTLQIGDKITYLENTSLINFPILEIEIIKEKRKTYDLSTDKTFSYFANGFHVHNSGFSLKFCAPLIRELWFSRGSPNYIATYEEPQVQKAWAEILEPYREHLNSYTPWYRDLNPDKSLNWRVAKEMVTETGRKVTKGRMNSLKGLVLSKSASKGVGGCNLKGTLIKMSDGLLKKVEDIVQGDNVIGKDGKPKKVITLFSGVSEMYTVNQSKGISYIVTPNHKLHLYEQKRNEYINIEVQDFIKLKPFQREKLNGIKHKGIVYSEINKSLPIDPYFLGLYLGDGNSGKYSILVNETKDIEISQYLEELSIKENHRLSRINRNKTRPEYNDQMWDILLCYKTDKKNCYTSILRKLGLKNKHIPYMFKTSSINQRLQLLAGLLDTDGFYNEKKARFEISIAKKDLFQDIKELCTDLGFKVKTSIKKSSGKKSTVYNKPTTINSLYIIGELWKIPVKIKRKKPTNIPRKNSSIRSKISITSYGVGEFYGFECEDHLYCLEDGTVTHNSAKYIFSDESGVNPVLSKFLGYVKPMISYGNVTTGTIIVSGAVGELKHLDGGLKDVIVNPEAQNFYWVDNIWDKDNEYAGKRCGFFVPESWAYYGVDENGVPFVDEHGNSDLPRTETYILKQREEIKSQSLESYMFAISQGPLSLMECFQYRSESVFPKDIIDHQISAIEMKKDHGTYIDLYETEKKLVKHKLLSKFENEPILDFPVKPKEIKNKDGVIQVWEFPMERPPYGLYWAGVDICRDSESLNSPSIHCIDIFKGTHKLSQEFAHEKPVASYRCRPKDKMDFYKKAMMLLDFYNAEALVENNVRWFIQEVIKDKKQHKISKTPKWLMDITPTSTSQLTAPYGVPMTSKLKDELIDTLVRYVSKVIYISYDEKTGEPTEHFGVENIKNIFVLREMLAWKPIKEQTSKDNYDNLISLGLAIMSAEKAEMLGIIQDDNYINSFEDLINRKNSKLKERSYISKSRSGYITKSNSYLSNIKKRK
jgi:hypothetical protein